MIETQKIKGFTLIELSIYLVIAGLLMAAALDSYAVYTRQKTLNTTSVNANTIRTAMARFLGNNGYLPCPADPLLAPTDPNAGREVCLDPPTGARQIAAYGAAIPVPATAAGMPATPDCKGAVCRAIGARDSSLFGFGSTSTRAETILTGAIPYVTLNIQRESAIDGWNNKYSYTVTESMTDPALFDDQMGVVRNQIRNAANGLDNVVNSNVGGGSGTPSAAMVAIVSHGPDGKGAYNINGILGPACVATDRDSENCDGDATFIDADPASQIISNGNNANFFDDRFTEFNIRRDSDKWAYSSFREIQNKTGGRVSIGGNATPREALHVSNGNILSPEIRGNSSGAFCDPGENNCTSANRIGGAGSNCSGGLAVGLGLDVLKCNNKTDISGLAQSNCANQSGKVLSGFTPSGGVICRNK